MTQKKETLYRLKPEVRVLFNDETAKMERDAAYWYSYGIKNSALEEVSCVSVLNVSPFEEREGGKRLAVTLELNGDAAVIGWHRHNHFVAKRIESIISKALSGVTWEDLAG